MERNKLEDFIKHCGSVTRAAKILKLKREHVSAMRNGRFEMKVGYALEIEGHMSRHSNKKIHHLDLVSSYERNQLIRLRSNFNYSPFKLTKVLLNNVKYHTKSAWIPDEFSDLNKSRPIILDENNQLIANPITYFLYLQNYKKMIPAWLISLSDLVQEKYEVSHLINSFDLIERGSIGIALDHFIGNRKGQRTDLKEPVENSPQVCLLKGIKTRKFISELLGLGSDYTYRQLKKIIQHGSDELIEKVRNKKITISAAAAQVVCL